MGELHLPRKTMDQLDRSFWESIETERVHFLGGPLPQDGDGDTPQPPCARSAGGPAAEPD